MFSAFAVDPDGPRDLHDTAVTDDPDGPRKLVSSDPNRLRKPPYTGFIFLLPMCII